MDGLVKKNIISVKLDVARERHRGNLVNINNKQKRTKNRALWNSGRDLTGRGSTIIQYNMLRTVREIVSKPFKEVTADSYSM